MASPFPVPVTATQVGTYFVGQYYQVLQQQPDYVYQFYSEASTMLRVDGATRETASAMLQIHALIMSLNFTGIEIKTAHSLESWNGGVLVMVSGSVQVKNFSGRRKFMQTFFLAPQEKGFFVLNDIFHFIDEEPIHHHPAVLLAHSNLDSKLNNASTRIPEPVSNYLLSEDIQAREFVAPIDAQENGPVDNYSFADQQVQEVPDSENILEKNSAEESNGSLQNVINAVQDHLPASIQEPAGEPQKHTYASILRVAKGQAVASVTSQPSVSKNTEHASDWNNAPQLASQQPVVYSNAVERSGADMADEVSAIEDEGEIKSVYVRNLASTVSEFEIEEEFKKFGEVCPDGVVIRSRKDVGVCYAFVEFEDMAGVHNAVKAGTAQVAGRPVYIEERRPNSNIPFRGGRRGRARGSYQTEAPRGRYGARSYSRGGSYDGGDRDYNRPRGNGFYRPAPRHDRGFSGHQVSRNGQDS